MTLGVKALKFSANAALDEGKPRRKAGRDHAMDDDAESHLVARRFVFLYKFVPLFLATRLGNARARARRPLSPSTSSTACIRMVIFLPFLFLLSRMKDIRRVFQYHGAEHKVVFNFESGKPVNCRKRPEVH